MERTPTVRHGYLHGAGHKYPLSLASPGWQNWLRVNKRFYVESPQGRVSVYRIQSRWVAQKRVKGQLRQKRLGNTAQLARIPGELLADLAEAISEDS